AFWRAHFISHESPVQLRQEIENDIVFRQIKQVLLSCLGLDLHHRVNTNGQRTLWVFVVALDHYVAQILWAPRGLNVEAVTRWLTQFHDRAVFCNRGGSLLFISGSVVT